MMKKKHVVVIGLGGVGGYFGFKINRLNETQQAYNITFVARNQTFQAVKENGLILLSPEFNNPVTIPDAVLEEIQAIESPDLVLVCVKAYSLEAVCTQLQPVLQKETVILPLMNGADIYERIHQVLPDHPVLPTCVYVASHLKAPGVVLHKGQAGKIITGKDEAHPDVDLEWVMTLLHNSQIECDFLDNPFLAIWTKFTFIASFGLVTARYNSSFDVVCTHAAQRQEATEIMTEIKAIAHKKGIALAADVIEKTFDKAGTFPPNTPSSLQLDVQQKKEGTELELFAGTIMHYGLELGVETPATKKIYTEIKQLFGA
jgi:2-dehydropantoate 2-reductase